MMGNIFGHWLSFYIVGQIDKTFYWPLEEVLFLLGERPYFFIIVIIFAILILKLFSIL